jgi:hypothetical protein
MNAVAFMVNNGFCAGVNYAGAVYLNLSPDFHALPTTSPMMR